MPRAYTAEEVKETLLWHVRHLMDYWNRQDGDTLSKMDGLVFSILNIFDGTSMGLPAIDLHLAPHPDDKEYHISQGEDYYEPGLCINDCQLHEEWIKYSPLNRGGKDVVGI